MHGTEMCEYLNVLAEVMVVEVENRINVMVVPTHRIARAHALISFICASWSTADRNARVAVRRGGKLTLTGTARHSRVSPEHLTRGIDVVSLLGSTSCCLIDTFYCQSINRKVANQHMSNTMRFTSTRTSCNTQHTTVHNPTRPRSFEQSRR